MTVYEPVLDGKQKGGLNNAGRRSQGEGHSYAGNGYAGNAHAVNGKTGQNYRPTRVANAGAEMPPPRYPRAGGAAPSRYNDDNSGISTRVPRQVLRA
jgi:hypothetical protein